MLHFSAPGFPPIKIIFPRTLLLCRVSNKMFNCLAFNRFERRNKDCNLGLLLTSKLLSWFYSQTKYSRLLFYLYLNFLIGYWYSLIWSVQDFCSRQSLLVYFHQFLRFLVLDYCLPLNCLADC